MKKILAAMLLILIVILAAGAGYQWWSSGNGNKKQFQKSQEIFGNPLMGYAPSAWYENVSEDISLLYMDITWAELEPEEGVYAWDSIEEENQINRWKKEGKHLILRFVCDIPGDEKHMDIPRWLYEKTGEDGTWYQIQSGSVTGYIKAEYFVTGKEAEQKAQSVGTEYGTVVGTPTLRLRQSPDLTSKTLTLLSEGASYVVLEEQGDFLKVAVDSDLEGYVYKE